MKIKDVEIDYLGHSGFLIVSPQGKKIAIDPYNLSEKTLKVDVILVTHSHYDHCSIKDIEKISQKGTVIILPASCQSKITKIEDVEMQIIEVGEELKLGNLKVEAVPAYNIGKEFHLKTEGWLGYLIKFEGLTIYHAGDSDKIPEMERLTGHGKKSNDFVVLLPVSGTCVMDVDEAVEVAETLSPTLAIPMHYGAGVAGTLEDAKRFCEFCEKKGINAKILEKV